MTLANRITIVRLLLVPVFVVLVMAYTQAQWWIRFLALGVFLAATISDSLDGIIARAYNQKTRLGAVLDPLADKLLINIAFVVLAVNREFKTFIPWWAPVIILSRDVIIVLGSYLINEFFGPVRIRPRFLGKLTTSLQMASIIAVLLELPIAYPLLMAVVGFTVVSLFDYVHVGVKQVGNEDAA